MNVNIKLAQIYILEESSALEWELLDNITLNTQPEWSTILMEFEQKLSDLIKVHNGVNVMNQ